MKTTAMGHCLGVLVLLGCSDGYPPKGDSLNLNFQMTQAQAIDALNTIGGRPHLKHEWRYQMQSDCALHVSTSGKVIKGTSKTVPMRDTEVLMLKSDSSDLYSVVMVPQNTHVGVLATVLADGTWSDASQAKWVLDYLPKFCSSNAPL